MGWQCGIWMGRLLALLCGGGGGIGGDDVLALDCLNYLMAVVF